MIPIILFVLAQGIWLETTQADFADGIFERNVFVSHRNGGALEFVPRLDLNNDGYIDLLTADASGSYVRIYWGSDDGYSEDSVSLFSTTGAANCDAADLNHDDYPDLLVAHRLTPKVTIYWGSPTGPNPSFYFDFPTATIGRQGIYIADPNKDGYLDIITSQEYIPGYSSVFGEIVLAIVLIDVLIYPHLSVSIILKSQILTGIVGLIFSSLNMDIHSTESTGEAHQATHLLNTLFYLGREVMALQ